jgi:hypothetical protein
MKKISDSAAEVIKHTWEAYWNSHQRKYLTQNFKYGMVLYKADFSATMDLNPQDRMNCAIPAHALQHVMIFSLSSKIVELVNKEGLPYKKRVIKNIGFNFFASGNYTLKTNYYFHSKCLSWAFRYLREEFGYDATRELYGFTDGCGEQFKSKNNALDIARFCDNENVDRFVHTFAITANFKCNIDAFGSDTKTYISRGEKAETIRCESAEKVYVQCRDHMPQPQS